MTTTSLRPISASALHEWLGRDDVLLIDIRDPDEHARVSIPQAQLMPLSTLTRETLAAHHASKVVFYCQSGRRTEQARAQLESLGVDNIWSLDGGLAAWGAASFPVRKSPTAVTMSIARQVQVAVGLLMLLGVILGYFVAAPFLLVSAAVGAGLLFAGLTGSCMLAAVLARAPWNRVLSPTRAPVAI